MRKRMLVIDDDRIVLDSVKKVFTDEGFDVTATDNPDEGLRLASSSSFDVILVDWKMPGFDGMDVVEELDRRAPDSTVIMISGYPTVGRATEALKRGAMDYLPKPFTPDEIKEVVRRALERKVLVEKRSLSRLEKVLKSWSFPTPSVEDLAPKTIAETVATKIGVGKTTSPWVAVFVLGILAGCYIGFGGLLSTVVTFDMAERMGIGFTRFMGGAVFSLGLMLVVIAGAELFTGNNLMVSSVLQREITFSAMMKRWGLVYLANFIGSIFLALMLYLSGLWKMGDGALGVYSVGLAAKKVSLSFTEALFRGIGCNWLVCLAVWMALASRQVIGKIFAIFFPIMGFVAIGFEHCIANMYFIPAGIFLKNILASKLDSSTAGYLTWGSFLYKNLLPVTIGNVIGGAVFVGMSYWSAYLKPVESGAKT